MPRPEFKTLPSELRRTHPDDTPGASGVPDKSGPGKAPRKRAAAPRAAEEVPSARSVSDTPDKSGKSDSSGGPRRTRTTRGTSETVKRATFWLTEADAELLEALRTRVDVPGMSGVPDKSAVVRHAIRTLAERELGQGEIPTN